ncbi:MAG: helix-turn-helix domain-containing protein [Planctomycetota bacterium]|jgi:excisionase family DNA binding protein
MDETDGRRPNPKDPYLSVNQVAELLGFHPWSVYRMCRDGTVKSSKISNRRLIKYSDIKSMIEDTDPKSPQSWVRRDAHGRMWIRCPATTILEAQKLAYEINKEMRDGRLQVRRDAEEAELHANDQNTGSE